MQQCPKCQSRNVHRSRSKSFLESIRKRLTSRRPYRCRTCGWRGWSIDYGQPFADCEIEIASRAVNARLGEEGDDESTELNLADLDLYSERKPTTR